MKVIVVGIGNVGFTIAEKLVKEKHEVILVDTKGEVLNSALESIDVFCVKGNGADASVLEEAGASEADILIAVTRSDEINILSCLVAKKLGVSNTMARVRNPEYYDSLDLIRRDVGLSLVMNPENVCADEMVRVLELPNAINVETFARGRAELVSFSVSQNNIMCGKKISDIFKNLGADVLICAVERGDDVYIPSGNFIIEAGDIVSIIAPKSGAAQFLRKIGLQKSGVKKVMIVGASRTASYLVPQLLSHGIDVTVIEASREKAEELCAAFPKANVICGDGTSPELLLEEGLPDTDALCSLMGIDEANIILSMFAREVQPKLKTITKVSRSNLRDVMRKLDTGTVVSPRLVTANIVLQYVRALQNRVGSGVLTLYKIISDKVEALEFYVGKSSSLVGIPLEELKLKKNILIACINRGGNIIMPHGRDCLEAGDTVVVITTMSGLDELDHIKR